MNPGFGEYTVDSLMPRSDRKNIPMNMYASLLSEGSQMTSIDTIEIDGTKKIHVTLTSAASPHTPACVPYNYFDKAFRKHSVSEGVTPGDGALISYEDENNNIVIPESAPLHMIVWLVLENENGLFPVDLADMAADLDDHVSENHVRNKFKLQLSEEKMIEIFEAVHRKAKIARATLLDLYNNVFRTNYSRETSDGVIHLLPEKMPEDIMQGFAYGFYRKDDTKSLQQSELDGLGGGPMSNATAHFHICAHVTMGALNEANLASKTAGFADIVDFLQQSPEYFKRSVGLVSTRPDFFGHDEVDHPHGAVLKDLLEKTNPYELLKLIDPYATIAHELMSEWLESRVRKHFETITNEVSIFQHNGGEYGRELRAVEGVELVVDPRKHASLSNERLKALMYAKATELIGQEVFPLWYDVRSLISEKVILSNQEFDDRIVEIQERHDLPNKAVAVIRRLKPTEKQIKLFLERDGLEPWQIGHAQSELSKYHRDMGELIRHFQQLYGRISSGEGNLEHLAQLLTTLQKLQLYDSDWNQGYNIPGVPGFAITHNRNQEGKYHMMIGWLLSKKGLSEAWLGAILSRPT